MRAHAVAVASFAVLLGSAADAAAQGQPFFDGLWEVRAAVRGTFGDEGRSLAERVDNLSARLTAWDDTITERASAYRAELRDAAPAEAAQIHAALGALFLQRSRLQEALAEYDAASLIAPQPGRFQRFRGAILEVLGRADDAAAAFHSAWLLDPDDPLAAYLALTRGEAGDPDRERMRDTLLRAQREAIGGSAGAPADAFLPIRAFGDPRAAVPVFPLARYGEAFARHLEGAHEDGLTALRSAAVTDPLVVDSAMDLPAMAQASAALRQGEIGAAVTALEAVVDRAPDSSEARRLLATAYDLAGDLVRSIEQLEIAIGLRQDDERSWLDLVRARRVTADVAGVRDTLERAVAAASRSGELRWQLAELSRVRDDGGAALTHYAEAARLPALAGDGGLYRWESELAYLLEDVERAVRVAERRLRLVPAQPSAHRDLANLYTNQGRHEAAYHELAIAVWLDPSDPISLSALGLNHLARGLPAEAVGPLERAVALSPGFRQARYALGQALVRVGRRKEGRQQLQEFQRMHTDWMTSLREGFAVSQRKRRAELESADGQHERAAGTWLEVIALDPDDAQNHLRLAEELLSAGLPEESLQALVNAAALDGVAEVHLRIANVLTLLGRDQEAALARDTYQRLRLADLTRPADPGNR